MSVASGFGQLVATFSIVGYDPANGDLGIAVATKYLAAGSSVPHAEPDVGAIAVQAYANPALAPRGLSLLEQGLTPDEVVSQLIDEDEGGDFRQLGIVDAQGRTATYTGHRCEAWAGGLVGHHCAAQGNMLTGEETVSAMVGHFVGSQGPLADRLVSSLCAGESAGGDKRGRQSSALLVVRPQEGLPIYDGRLVDLRVDSDPQPCQKLQELLSQYYQLHLHTAQEDYVPLTRKMVMEMQRVLKGLNLYEGTLHGHYDDATRKALWGFCVAENQKNRWTDQDNVDPRLYDFLIGSFGGSN